MTVYAIAQGRVDDRAQFDDYAAAAGPTLEAHGVELMAMDESPDVVEGQVPYPRTVILKFDSTDAFYRWYNSPEYQAARKLREPAVEGTFILVQGI